MAREEPGRNVPVGRRIVIIIVVVIIAAIQAFLLRFWTPAWAILYLIFGTAVLVSPAQWNEFRKKTPQAVITPNNRWSIRGKSDIYQAGLFKCFEVGGVEISGVSYGGGEGTIIVPDFPIIVNEEDKQYFINCIPMRTEFSQLPPKAKKTIQDNDLGEPYLFGIEPHALKEEINMNGGTEPVLVQIETDEGKTRYIPVDEAFTEMVSGLQQRIESISEEKQNLDETMGRIYNRIREDNQLAKELEGEGIMQNLNPRNWGKGKSKEE